MFFHTLAEGSEKRGTACFPGSLLPCVVGG
jgi:hypothetical protein